MSQRNVDVHDRVVQAVNARKVPEEVLAAGFRMENRASAATRSAAEQQEVGWPLPAAVVASMEWMRSWLAIPFNNSMSVSIINFMDSKINPALARKPRMKRIRYFAHYKAWHDR